MKNMELIIKTTKERKQKMNNLEKESRKADNLAIIALASIAIPLAAIIMGHMSLHFYKKTNTEHFKPVALIATVAGWLGILFTIVTTILLFVGVSSAAELLSQTGINL